MKLSKKILVSLTATTAIAALGACSSQPSQSDINGETAKYAQTQPHGVKRNIATGKKVVLPPITNCHNGGYGMLEGTATIKNRSSKKQSFLVTGEVVNKKGDRLAELDGAVNDLQPGQKSDVDMVGSGSKSMHGTLTCRLVSVDAF